MKDKGLIYLKNEEVIGYEHEYYNGNHAHCWAVTSQPWSVYSYPDWVLIKTRELVYK